MRAKFVMAALMAAALAGGGTVARAMTPAPDAAWVYDRAATDNSSASISTPELPFLVASPAAPLATLGGASASPFAFDAASPLGQLSGSGDAAAVTVPHLLPGGLIDRDGPYYTVRDAELVDRVTDNLAFELGYDFDLGRRFDAMDVRADPEFAGLFLSPADLNFSGLGESGVDAGASVGLGDGFSLDLGGSESGPDRNSLLPLLLPFPSEAGSVPGFDQREAQTVLAGVNWKFAPWGSMGIAGAHNAVRTGFLGGAPSLGALSLAKGTADTVGATGRIAFGGGWITSFSYNESVTQLDLRPGANLLTSDTLHGGTYALAVAKHGLFGDDTLGLAVSRPLNLGNGIDFGWPATADPFDGFISANTRPILGGTTPETDLQLGYVTTFMDGALALQANAGYQMNAEGQTGANGVTVLSRAKINF